MKPLDRSQPRRILVRGTNWVGDAVMNLPALEALHRACPQAELIVLARPWVAAVYEGLDHVAGVRVLDSSGRHKYAWGRLRLARELRAEHFDWAVLLQNAIEAALIALGAGVPVRIGFNSDGRGPLLTHSVPRKAFMRRVHETSYYLWMLRGAGLLDQDPPDHGVAPELKVTQTDARWAANFLADHGLDDGRPIGGLAPGAAFGPAKRWPAERFAGAADLLAEAGIDTFLCFGSTSERPTVQEVAGLCHRARTIDLSGRTTLGQALALMHRAGLMVTNDSGLMHASAALGAPTVAVFGSTNPIATGPLGPWTKVVCHHVDCAPCKKAECPTDLRCLTGISSAEVAEAGLALWREARR